jgi:hypothetical protein
MKHLKINTDPSTLPSTPITRDDSLYATAKAMAVAAGAIKETDRPASISYAHGTKSWSIGW